MSLAFGPFTFALAGLIPHSRLFLATLQQELRRAGHYRPFALQEFLSIRNSLVFGWLLLVATTLWVAYDPVKDPTFLILAVGAVGLIILYSAPRLWLQMVGNNRVRRIQLGLPDALDMVTMCLSGGLPLLQSLERVSKELKISHPDIAQEFEIICRHAEAHTLEYAITHFADRIDAPEIRSLSALVTQTDRLGTNVGGALRDYSDSMRRSYRQRAEERGNRASVKMLLPVSLCLAPPVYILLMAPAVLELRDFVTRENKPGGVLKPNLDQNARLTQERRIQMDRDLRDRQQKRRANAAEQNAARANRRAANAAATPDVAPDLGDEAPARPRSAVVGPDAGSN